MRFGSIRWLAIVVAGLVYAADPVVTLKTQFGDESRIMPPEKSPAIILYSDREGSALARPWLEAIGASDAAIIEIAHLGAVPAIARPFVRRGFRNSSPVFLDWRGDIAATFGFAEDLPNVYLLDADGRLCRHLFGALDETMQAELHAAMMECMTNDD